VRAIIGPLAGGFNGLQKQLSERLDPGRAADSTLYCGEGEFDMSRIEPSKVERLTSLIKKYGKSE
jgi:hypothetical protein